MIEGRLVTAKKRPLASSSNVATIGDQRAELLFTLDRSAADVWRPLAAF